MLAVDMAQFDESLRIDEASTAPTLAALRGAIWPEWEYRVDASIRDLTTNRFPAVMVPNFHRLAEADY